MSQQDESCRSLKVHDIRLLSSGPHTSKGDPVLVAMCGGKKDQ